MTIGVYHKGFILLQTENETLAWEKAKQYRYWFTNVEVRKIEQESSARQ